MSLIILPIIAMFFCSIIILALKSENIDDNLKKRISKIALTVCLIFIVLCVYAMIETYKESKESEIKIQKILKNIEKIQEMDEEINLLIQKQIENEKVRVYEHKRLEEIVSKLNLSTR